MRGQSYIFYVIAGILVVTALVLGVAIFRQTNKSANKKNQPASQNTRSSSPNGANQNQAQQQRQNTTPVTPNPNLTADEKQALNPPKTNDPIEQKKFFDLITKLAKDSTELDISGCSAKPVVFRTKHAATFKVVNKDSTEHTMVIDKDRTYKVPAKGSTEVKADFGKAAGIYGYGCDSSGAAVGMLFTY